MTPEIKQRIDKICHGEVPEGYQRTFLGIAPKSWDKSRIDKICRLSSGSTPRRDAVENFAGDILWVTSGELKRRTIEDTREKISETAVVNSHLEIYDPGTVVIAIYGLEAAGIRGTVSIIGKQCTISQACMAFTEFKGIDNEFFYYWYLNNGQVIGLRYAQGTKQQNLSTDIVGSFPICFPSQGEQQKIAAILTTQDRVIELKEKRLAEKQRQKKYLMQQLLTGKKRLPGFSEEWKKVKIGSFIKEIDERSTVNNQYEILSVTKNGMVFQSSHFNKQIASENNVGYKVVRRGNLAFSTMNLWMGSLDTLRICDTGIVSPAYKVFEFNQSLIVVNFAENYMKSAEMIWLYKANSEQGASIVRRNLDLQALLNSEVALPDISEQTAIAEVLSAADHEIDLLRQDIEQEKQKKKALMQLLLTGIVRV
jgi:type I restriction enzyme S subunit